MRETIAMATAVTLPRTEMRTLHSRSVGDAFEIWIGQPMPRLWGDEGAARRVLVALDAEFCFGLALDSTRLMHALYGEIGPHVVVGVGYGGDDWLRQATLRTRDYTPSETPKLDMPGAGPRSQATAGGAAKFLAFLQTELRPLLSAEFGLAEAPMTLCGSSLGGLFSLWTYLAAPKTFESYIAISPAIWWDKEGLIDRASRVDAATAPPIFIGVGALEEDPRMPMLAPFEMITNVRALSAAIASAGARVDHAVIDGETHTSVIGPGLTRGLRFIGRS